MGLLHENGTPKLALEQFAAHTPDFGICQWFHFDDHRLDEAVQWLHRLGVKYLRTGLSWADSFRSHALDWFDRQMQALEAFDVTLTFCFTPESRGIMPHHTSPPQCIEEFAEFCVQMVRRYGHQCSTPPLASELEVRPVNLGVQRAAIPAGGPSLILTGQSDRLGDSGGTWLQP
jgi:beta-xylosidase